MWFICSKSFSVLLFLILFSLLCISPSTYSQTFEAGCLATSIAGGSGATSGNLLYRNTEMNCTLHSDLNGGHAAKWSLQPDIAELGKKFGRDFMLSQMEHLLKACLKYHNIFAESRGTTVNNSFDDILCDCNEWVYEGDFQCKTLKSVGFGGGNPIDITSTMINEINRQDVNSCIVLTHISIYYNPRRMIKLDGHTMRVTGASVGSISVEDPNGVIASLTNDGTGITTFKNRGSTFISVTEGFTWKCPISLSYNLDDVFSNNSVMGIDDF